MENCRGYRSCGGSVLGFEGRWVCYLGFVVRGFGKTRDRGVLGRGSGLVIISIGASGWLCMGLLLLLLLPPALHPGSHSIPRFLFVLPSSSPLLLRPILWIIPEPFFPMRRVYHHPLVGLKPAKVAHLPYPASPGLL
ncbi:hypothetical protein AA313_de0205362 [Arthrobotrys entomopaga]|nr:hypothetical protein AA313_de0205362 [Arthrobotrys entomopaga]